MGSAPDYDVTLLVGFGVLFSSNSWHNIFITSAFIIMIEFVHY